MHEERDGARLRFTLTDEAGQDVAHGPIWVDDGNWLMGADEGDIFNGGTATMTEIVTEAEKLLEAESFPYYEQPSDDDGVPELIGAGSVFGSWSALSLLAGELATTL